MYEQNEQVRTTCVAYGDDITYEQRDKFTELLRHSGWEPVLWCHDARAQLFEPVACRGGWLEAMREANVRGIPVVVADQRDVRSRVELIKMAAAAATIGVEVALTTGAVLDGGTPVPDEIEFGFKSAVVDILAIRDAVVTAFAAAAVIDAIAVDTVRQEGLVGEDEPVGESADVDLAPVIELNTWRIEQYRQAAETYERVWQNVPLHAPRLPDPAASWKQRRQQIGTLAAFLSRMGLTDRFTAQLLNDLGVRPLSDKPFYAQLVSFYRRKYGRRAA